MDFHKTTSQKTSDFNANTQSKTQSLATNGERTSHKIELDHLRSATVTGVKDVPTFTDKTIIVKLDGETLTLQGEGLSVKNLDLDSGKLHVLGKINTLKYTAQSTPTSFAKKLFK